MDEKYEIRVAGLLGPGLRAAFTGMRCQAVPRQTVIRGRMSRDQLRLLLERLDKLGIVLVHLDCLQPGWP